MADLWIVRSTPTMREYILQYKCHEHISIHRKRIRTLELLNKQYLPFFEAQGDAQSDCHHGGEDIDASIQANCVDILQQSRNELRNTF